GGVDDRTGAVARVRAGVEDVDLVGVLAGDLVGVGAADEDAAVGVVADPELGADLEVAVVILRQQVAVLPRLVGYQPTVLDAPVGVADRCEVIGVLAVEQRDPALIGLAGGLVRRRQCGEPGEQRDSREGGPVLHGISLPLCLICGASLARGAWRKNDSKGGKGQEGGSELSLRAIPGMNAVAVEIVSSRGAPSQRRREIGVIEVSASPAPPSRARSPSGRARPP